jgi:excisionase family DNA binding protein
MSKIEQYYSADEIAEKLSLTPRVVRELLKSGELKGIKIGRSWRVPESNLKAFLKKEDEEK